MMCVTSSPRAQYVLAWPSQSWSVAVGHVLSVGRGSCQSESVSVYFGSGSLWSSVRLELTLSRDGGMEKCISLKGVVHSVKA